MSKAKPSTPRKSSLTKEARRNIYNQVSQESALWLTDTKEKLAERIKAVCFFSIDHETQTHEQLLRTLFIMHMKRMIE